MIVMFVECGTNFMHISVYKSNVQTYYRPAQSVEPRRTKIRGDVLFMIYMNTKQVFLKNFLLRGLKGESENFIACGHILTAA